MSQDCINCSQSLSLRKLATGKIRAKSTLSSSNASNFSSISNIRGENSAYIVLDNKFSSSVKLSAKETLIFSPNRYVSYDNSKISGFLNIDGNVRSKVASSSNFTNSFVGKVGGSLQTLTPYFNFNPNEKLYPIKDLIVSKDGNFFANENSSSGNLYDSINEGVFEDQYDNSNFIQPSSIYTPGSYRYKCRVSDPYKRPEGSYLLIRAIAPMKTNSSNVPPVYKFSNIKLEDPSGNLIIKYKDINVRGDADYSQDFINYATYVTEPEINYGALNTWEENYPILGSGNTDVYLDVDASGYTLNINLDIECLDDPFDVGFNVGYEEQSCEMAEVINYNDNDHLALDGEPISSQSSWYQLNPRNNTIRITAVEIINSGQAATLTSHYMPLYSQVPESGNRISKIIYPSEVLVYDYDTTIYPNVDSIWESDVLTNASGEATNALASLVRNTSTETFITLTDPQSSGKLKLKFADLPPPAIDTLRDGSLNVGWFGDDLDYATFKNYSPVDHFYTIDAIELKVIAKKATGVRDYNFDVVGYSDDKLLNVTSAVGGFLQNTEGTGNMPASSGYGDINELAISAESLSERDSYFEASGTNNAGGDHYKLSTNPTVDSTVFEEYTIPLTIYNDSVSLGQSTDYSMSSFFENLYVDLYPIPSGASIASISLVVYYKPSNAIMLHTVGQANREMENRSITLLPSSGISKDIISSSGRPLSLIENIPHGFAPSGGINGETTLKSNYARRWRGVFGDKVVSDFNVAEFDYSFEKDFIEYPFIDYYDFNHVTENSVLAFNSTDKVSTTTLLASGNINIIKNLGSRFNTTSLFDDATDYQTIDWTSITGYENDYLYGKIHDGFDSAIRISGDNSYLYTYDVGNLSDGFAAFIRFSPDIDVSGVGYNLFNSGVIFGQFDSDLSFAVGFKDGYLTAYAKDADDNIIEVQDTWPYESYSYPLAIGITYNEEGDNKLRLYTDNESTLQTSVVLPGNILNTMGGFISITNNNVTTYKFWNNLRATSDSFEINDTLDPLTIGFSRGSGVGMNMFVTDFGISYFDADESIIGKMTEDDFVNLFDDVRMPFIGQDFRYKLWQRVDEDVDKWHLGAFKICEFNQAFDRFTHRIGSDYVFHYLNHHGSGYEQICDVSLPSNIPTGLAYHTQIENDMLRFGLGSDSGNMRDALYSPLPRINKNLSRGYNFDKDAIVVETILEHDTFNNISWGNGEIGPRLIVGLYTTIKDPQTYPATNYGLINRQFHNLEPSGCWRKISTVFDPQSFFDDSTETWSNFPSGQRLTEFNHKYFSRDIDNIFVQYDLAYPSGEPFESSIKIHSVNVKMRDALVQARDASGIMNLISSGGTYVNEDLNLSMPYVEPLRGDLNLSMKADIIDDPSGLMNLFGSGGLYQSDSMILHTTNIRKLSNTGEDTDIFGSYDPNYGFVLYTSGQYFDDEYLPLYTENKLEDQSSSGVVSLVAYNKLNRYSLNNTLEIYTRGAAALVNHFPESIMNLFVQNDRGIETSGASMNLYVNPSDLFGGEASGSMSLFTINYSVPNKLENQAENIDWNSSNFGVDIELDDNDYATLPANDEIRGVDITCYGNCNEGGTCEEVRIITHETIWQDSFCVEGGIFRASNVYTNLDVGYSGNFYGIRKYVGLIPNAPYKLSITGRTADGDLINVPRELETIEYGRSETATHSGIKLIGDSPYVPSGRYEGDEYGKSVSVVGDLMIVGSPKHDIQDSGANILSDAGSVFVYRRDAAPTGSSWDYDKAEWNLETKLTLPFESGDYVDRVEEFSIKDTSGAEIAVAPQTFWKVGQDGRQLGHSVDISVYNDKEIIVAGGPSAKWTRTFSELQPSGVNVGLMIFTDTFKDKFIIPGSLPVAYKTYEAIRNAIKDKDILFKYCASPFPVQFNVKVMICEANAERMEFASGPYSVDTNNLSIRKQITYRSDDNIKTASGIKQIFNETFPHDPTLLNSGIPPLLGIFVDSSASFGGSGTILNSLHEFISYYQDYSYASGLVDFDELPATGAAYIFEDNQEDWIDSSIASLNYVLDTGRLIDDNQFRFFAEEIIPPNGELAEFNVPPPSGGVVYVFENESGIWNLIQEIESPNVSNSIAPDRFGHTVKISDNGEIIVVGSPYTNDAVTVYQYDEREKDRMYNNVEDWVEYHRINSPIFGYYWSLQDRYNELKTEYGKDHASRLLYIELTAQAKHDLRNNSKFWQNRGGGAEIVDYSEGYYNGSKTGKIQEYQKIYTYGYGNIPYQGGTWSFLLDKFAPTSRLGYSVAVNEDGSIVAAGAPTDSFNEYDDKHKYAMYHLYDDSQKKSQSTWYSTTNAGAVRVFESRKYYPHSIAMEYGKFGNLAYENRENDEDRYFNHIGAIFGENGRTFIKTAFSDVNIPEEAGLVFIITPAIDALSDEILTNIKNWLALGDRHLVLVGEDPVWEKEGLYKESNDIINKILVGLKSRMHIAPARNAYEALASGCPDLTKPNVIRSFKPSKTRSTYITIGDMFGYGVGDIRMSWKADSRYTCELSQPNNDGDDDSYQALNAKFKIPMLTVRVGKGLEADGGDLRAQWLERCYNRKGNPITYAQNWAMLLGSVTQSDYGCYDGDDDPDPPSPTAGYDPVPLLAAAEYPPEETIIYPAVPAASSYLPVEFENYPIGTTTTYKFSNNPLNSTKQFAWSEEYTDYVDGSLITNIGGFNPGQFFNPEAEENKDAVLQAKGVTRFEEKQITVDVYDDIYYTAKERLSFTDPLHPETNAKADVILVAGLSTESSTFLYENGGFNEDQPNDSDAGLNFYHNMVRKNVAINIAQLGGWTGRTSFADANSSSVIKDMFKNRNPSCNVTENVTTHDLYFGNYDVCWIANPTSIPEGDDIIYLKSWLALGNKKLVITYETVGEDTTYGEDFNKNVNYDTIRNVEALCSILNSTMKPVYLEGRKRFALHKKDGAGVSDSDNLTIKPDDFLSTGFTTTNSDNITSLVGSYITKNFVPIDKGNGVGLAYINKAIQDVEYVDVQLWEMKTNPAKIEFVTLPGSGYKLFVDVYSKNISELKSINIDVTNCVNNLNSDSTYDKTFIVYDGDEQTTLTKRVGLSTNINATSANNTISTREYNIKSTSDKITVYISVPYDQGDTQPITTRLVGISGCLLPIETTTDTQYATRPSRYDWVITSPAVPEQVFTYQPPFREISTDNTKYSRYCTLSCESDCLDALGDQLIADGPIVVAQELEQFSAFENGENRSRITVISDSSLIQGRCMVNENGVINQATINFIKSLYPPNPSQYVTRGRQFTSAIKLTNQERLTPQELYSANGNVGQNLRFTGDGTASSGTSMTSFIEEVYNPADLERPYEPWEALPESNYMVKLEEPLPEDEAEELKEQIINSFDSDQYAFGATAKFSGVIEGTMYEDASYLGGIPQIMTDKGYDYLDFDRFPSGYPGDLFGYSLALYGTKLVIGAPFASFADEELVTFSGVANITSRYTKPSGTISGFNGGAGAVYIYERTGSGITPQGRSSAWQCTRKIRPDSINVGQDIDSPSLASSGFYLGDHNYSSIDLIDMSITNDQFGYDVDIDGDTLIIGSPGHDFTNYFYESGGAFRNKDFGFSSNISIREVTDVGESGIRNLLKLSGSGTTAVINNGAVYVYENRINDWINKSQSWEFVEKIVPQGYKARLQKDYSGSVAISGSENDYFGTSISIDRAKRTDSDYTVAVGTPCHKFATSGNHVTADELNRAGAMYVYDIMLRERAASSADPNTFIDATVFGQDGATVKLVFSNGSVYGKKYEATGIVYSNNQGEIFLEASGKDPTLKGFIKHRPYIESVKGQYAFGIPVDEAFRLYIEGQPPISSGNINLFMNCESGIVYNTLGMYGQGVTNIESGNLPLYTESPSGLISESGLHLYVGIGTNTETLNMSVRGK